MKLSTIVPASFLVSFIVIIVGAYMKITHSEGADPFLMIGLIAWLVFIVSAIYEVRTSHRNHIEKTFWTVALLLFGSVAGVVYMFSRGRNMRTRG